jgi:hypothetical protein
LKTLPKDDPQVADVLSGLAQIGQVQVNIRDAANLFEIQVYKSDTAEPITRTRIPYNPPTSNSTGSSQVSSSLVQTVETNAEEARPLLRKHWIVKILTDPLTYVELWVGLFIVSWVGSNLIRRWAFERRDRQSLYRLVRLPVNVTRYVFMGVLLAVGGALLIGQVLFAVVFSAFMGSIIGGPVGAIIGTAIGLWSGYALVREKLGERSAQSN